MTTRIPYRLRPGSGFVVLVLVVLGSISFFAWGARTPRLDEVWRLERELRLTKRPHLSERERRLVQDALCAYPNVLAPGLLSLNHDGRVARGNAMVVVPADGESCVLIRAAETKEGRDATVSIAARGLDHLPAGVATTKTPFCLVVPPHPRGCPQLVDVRVDRSAMITLEKTK